MSLWKNKKARLLVVFVVLAAAIAIPIYMFQEPANPVSPSNHSSSDANRKTSNILTAGGTPVPARFQSKAKSLGYYCPSWAAKPGVASSSVCFPLDK